jgi:hypothetical protein
MVIVPWDLSPRITALARTSSNCTRQTGSLVREMKLATLYQQQIYSLELQMGLDTKRD